MNIAVSDGDKTSNGHTRVLKLTGSLSSEATLTITPDDREAFYIVHNTAGDARFKQISLILVLWYQMVQRLYLCRW